MNVFKVTSNHITVLLKALIVEATNCSNWIMYHGISFSAIYFPQKNGTVCLAPTQLS